MDDLSGGTFTITNGGVFGSLVSTPIINVPQVAILGLHKTQDRPIVVNGEIVVRPMMYVALSYDHRIIDGQQAVLFREGKGARRGSGLARGGLNNSRYAWRVVPVARLNARVKWL